MDQRTDETQYQTQVLDELRDSYTNIKDMGLDYNVDGCSCMSCGCFKSAWTIVVSPVGVAAGLAAYATAAAL